MIPFTTSHGLQTTPLYGSCAEIENSSLTSLASSSWASASDMPLAMRDVDERLVFLPAAQLCCERICLCPGALYQDAKRLYRLSSPRVLISLRAISGNQAWTKPQ